MSDLPILYAEISLQQEFDSVVFLLFDVMVLLSVLFICVCEQLNHFESESKLIHWMFFRLNKTNYKRIILDIKNVAIFCGLPLF
jgi:hypothetical protein